MVDVGRWVGGGGSPEHEKGRREGAPAAWWSRVERGAYEIKGGRRGEGLVSAVATLRSHEAEAMTHGKPAYARAIPWPAWCWRCEMAYIVWGVLGLAPAGSHRAGAGGLVWKFQ